MRRKVKSESLENIKKELEQWQGKYLRALADYQNLEKRTRQSRIDEARFAAIDFISKLLPVVDDLETVENELKNEGLLLAMKNLRKILESEHVERIEVTGKKFDPTIMECVEVVEDTKEDHVVKQVRPAYKMFEKVIRVAQVIVGKKSETGKEFKSILNK